MANIPSSAQYINDIEVSQDAPFTEALLTKFGGTINYLLDKSFAPIVFTSNGPWTCPNGITKISIIGCGGGSGGYGYNRTGSTNPDDYMVKGGLGAYLGMTVLSVVPGSVYNIQIGAGGAGGSGITSPGNGGNTEFQNASFTPIYRFLGANKVVTDVVGGQQVFTANGYIANSPSFQKGADAGFVANQYGLGGGAGAFGDGGTGARSTTGAVTATSGAANTGAGGGGALITNIFGPTATGGSGGSGILIIF